MKLKKAGTILMAFLFLCCGCKKKEQAELATIQDLYENEVTETDALGSVIPPKDTSRSITDTYPELTMYKAGTLYGGTYIPAYDKCLPSGRFEITYRDNACMVVKDTENPTASYIIGTLRYFTAFDSDQDCYEDMLPYMSIRKADDESIHYVILSQIEDSQQDQIGGKVGTGYSLTMICSDTYTPQYAYGVFVREDNLANCVLMVTDNIVASDGARKQGQPKEPVVIDTRSNKDGQTLYSVLTDKLPVNYSVYYGKTSIAVPSFMQVTENERGISVKSQDSYTPLDYAGMTVFYAGEPSMNDAVELCKETAAKEFGFAGSLNSIAVSDIHYDIDVKCLGVDNCKHIYGSLLPQKRTKNMAQYLPGNGHILFDIYTVNKGGNDYTVMFYYGESQKEEVEKWISYNCY